MSNHINNNQTKDDNELLDNELDIKHDKTKTSRLFFLIGFFGIFIFAWSGCYSLYQHKYKSPHDGSIKVNESSKLDPTYGN